MMAYSKNVYDPDIHKSVWLGIDIDDRAILMVETDGAVRLDKEGVKRLRNACDAAIRRMD